MSDAESWTVHRLNQKDWLLVAAKVGTILARIAFVIGMIALGVAGAVNVIDPSLISEHVTVEADAGLSGVTGGIVITIVLGLITLGLMYDFTTKLAQIIDTVGQGDPFTTANADRLQRMGYLALAVQVLGIIGNVLSNWLEPQLKDGTFELHSDSSLTAFGLALVLFILARVFRKGTEMREDLEGTV